MEKGRLVMVAWRSYIAAYIEREARPVDKFGHQPRLYALTTAVGEGQAYDDDVVYAAAWLHDLGVFTGHRPEDAVALALWDNTAYAMGRAPAVLSEAGFPATKIPVVVEVIRTHEPSADPLSLEGVILRDADILEQLGAIGVLRAVCKVGRDTRYPTFTAAAGALRSALGSLPAQLQLETSRALAVSKIRLLEQFLAGADSEAYGFLL